MALPDGFLDEIKARIRLSDLVGRTVALRRQGREFAGLSPFKKERTPSFFVNDEKGFYHCFSSQKNGDAVNWLQETQGLSFMEAVETLAAEAGLAMPAPDPEAARKDERRKELAEWNELAQQYFVRELNGPRGGEARAYLERRGLSPHDWENFGLGYAPEMRTGLKDFLINKGAKPDELVTAGLLIAPEDGGAAFDRFRGRVMFPIQDPRGRLVAFGGRALSKDARAKYLNSPETPLFHKSHVLYRYPQARSAASDPKAGIRGLIVAEGYMDVIALNRAGLVHAVAPLGTALTEDQIRLLWRAGPEPVICLDGDAAGQRAAGLAAERALPMLEPGKSLRFVFLPDGQDPDDVLKAKGAEALRALVADTRSLAELLWDKEFAAEPLTDPDRRAGFRRRLRALTSKIADPDVREEYKAEFDRRLASAFGRKPARAPWRGRQDASGISDGPPVAETRKLAQARRAAPVVRHLLLAAIEWPELAISETETLAELDCGPLDSLRDAILDACSNGQGADHEVLKSALVRLGHHPVLRKLEAERAPMRAAMGGEDADPSSRLNAWRKAAASYMERVEEERIRGEARLLESEALARGDAAEVHQLIAGYKASRRRR
ncbi:DNA primase [Glycocaulis abyssi]|uniref:DNA primase n=1 Tax=Glycocaulis abyssi TaxID=1433403 RepID=A0ABV9N9B3_9PROT